LRRLPPPLPAQSRAFHLDQQAAASRASASRKSAVARAMPADRAPWIAPAADPAAMLADLAVPISTS
jgi:hypothetical protein